MRAASLAAPPVPVVLGQLAPRWLRLVLAVTVASGVVGAIASTPMPAREAPWSAAITAAREPADARDRQPGARTSGVALFLLLVPLVLASGVAQATVQSLPWSRDLQPAPYDIVRVDGSRAPRMLMP